MNLLELAQKIDDAQRRHDDLAKTYKGLGVREEFAASSLATVMVVMPIGEARELLAKIQTLTTAASELQDTIDLVLEEDLPVEGLIDGSYQVSRAINAITGRRVR